MINISIAAMEQISIIYKKRKLAMPEKLALKGGKAIREGKYFPAWPIYSNGEREALNRTLESGKWGIGGTETEDFERKFAAYQNSKYCITMVNGSVTLRNALIACGLKEGEGVIVPPYTFLATASSVVEANCTPIFADIDPDTCNISPESIERNITPEVKAIIPVHFGGQPADMDKIMEIAAKYNLYVIEDCAHSHGAEYKGKRVGSIGHAGSFSFQSSKNLCCGEGGAIVSNNEDIADGCWSVHNCGRIRSGQWYQHENFGGNYRLSQFAAAILNEQIKKLDGEIEKREKNASYLSDKLSQIPGIKPLVRSKDTTRHSYHLYALRYDKNEFNGASKASFLQALNAEGIPMHPGYAPLHRQALFTNKNFASMTGYKHCIPDIDYKSVQCPNSEKASNECCWMHHAVLLGEKNDMDDIVNAILKIKENKKDLIG